MLDLNSLQEDITKAAKIRDSVRLTVLRLLKTALKNQEIEVGHDLSSSEILKVLQKEAKKRKDSIESYEKAGREDLVNEEKAELKIIDEYLPAEMSDEDLNKIVDEVIAQTGAKSSTDMGKVMGIVMGKVGSGADGNRVREVVSKKLN